MGYNIEGWVEVTWCTDEEQAEDYAWQSLLNLSVLIQVNVSVSEQLFGLSKRCTAGEITIQSLAAQRGVPANPSWQVKREIEEIREHEQQHGPGVHGGYTYATWQEIKLALDNISALDQSDWQIVFDLVRLLEQNQRYTADQIRFIAWYCW